MSNTPIHQPPVFNKSATAVALEATVPPPFSRSLGEKVLSAVTPKFPPQIKYIVGNEACERFSYYGMRAILVVFMTDYLMKSKSDAKATYHFFSQAVYFLPLVGAYISDHLLGKYKTIMYLSIVYCLGHLSLSVWDTAQGLPWGLALIAIGSGGIKPCVSAHVGDQFDETNKSLLDKVFGIFYFSINFGAFFSSLLIPFLLTKYGPSVAFGVPGILMAVATFIFWLGRNQYVHVPPKRTSGVQEAGFLTVVKYALLNRSQRSSGDSWLDAARGKYSLAEVEGVKATLAIIKVFATISVFWALFDQQGSSWTLQAKEMNLEVWGMKLEPSQIQALNPIMVMALIPFFSFWLYPTLEKLGLKLSPLRKMSAGMVLAGLSFVMIGLIQVTLDAGTKISVAWQILPYLVITASEVMVSVTGLEFAYTQAPKSMKSTLMSFWLLTVAVGNFLTAIVAKMNAFTGSGEFFFFATLMFAVSGLFVWGAINYRENKFVTDTKGL